MTVDCGIKLTIAKVVTGVLLKARTPSYSISPWCMLSLDQLHRLVILVCSDRYEQALVKQMIMKVDESIDRFSNPDKDRDEMA